MFLNEFLLVIIFLHFLLSTTCSLWPSSNGFGSTERELALKFDVSRMTLRQAIQTLADEGILERKIGSGTYVARKKVQETMTGTTSFTEITLSQNRVPSSRTVSYFVAKPSSSEMEKLQLGSVR